MMSAYDKLYLEKAKTTLGSMLDYAVNTLGFPIRGFWDTFLESQVSKSFQVGNPSIVAGRSGIELCLMVTDPENKNGAQIPIRINDGKSPEYWAGWALAYYQWGSGLQFKEIDRIVPIESIVGMYFPYHELDIRQFADRMDELILSEHKETNIKRKRIMLGLTQSQLACYSNIPLRTLQQYEQGQKNINAARASYLISLSKALYCNPEELLEYQGFEDKNA